MTGLLRHVIDVYRFSIQNMSKKPPIEIYSCLLWTGKGHSKRRGKKKKTHQIQLNITFVIVFSFVIITVVFSNFFFACQFGAIFFTHMICTRSIFIFFHPPNVSTIENSATIAKYTKRSLYSNQAVQLHTDTRKARANANKKFRLE